MKYPDLIKYDLPDTPGVYFFRDSKGRVLYIGKASSLVDRVKSYFSSGILLSRGSRITRMLEKAKRVDFIQTSSVLEAIILEAIEIKKHQPPYNVREKDDRSYNFVVITKEEFPRVLIRRGRDLASDTSTYHKIFGPFPQTSELKEALRIIRKIFPFRDEKCKLTGKPCFGAQIGLCPGPCAGRITKRDYAKIIRNLTLFFEAKKSKLIVTLKKEMKAFADSEKFEEAEKVKRQIFALEHIQDVALLKTTSGFWSDHSQANFRIEAYDIAHLSGKNTVGVMVVIKNGELNKSQYRKFKIKTDVNDDIRNLKEVIARRLRHPEWPLPNLIVVDGGLAQLNAAKAVLEETGLNVRVVSVVKDEKHRQRKILGLEPILLSGFFPKGLAGDAKKSILLANSEAHRFAIAYHRKLHRRGFKV